MFEASTLDDFRKKKVVCYIFFRTFTVIIFYASYASTFLALIEITVTYALDATSVVQCDSIEMRLKD